MAEHREVPQQRVLLLQQVVRRDAGHGRRPPDVIAGVHFMSGLYRPHRKGTPAVVRARNPVVQEPSTDDQEQPEDQKPDVPRQWRAEVVKWTWKFGRKLMADQALHHVEHPLSRRAPMAED